MKIQSVASLVAVTARENLKQTRAEARRRLLEAHAKPRPLISKASRRDVDPRRGVSQESGENEPGRKIEHRTHPASHVL